MSVTERGAGLGGGIELKEAKVRVGLGEEARREWTTRCRVNEKVTGPERRREQKGKREERREMVVPTRSQLVRLRNWKIRKTKERFDKRREKWSRIGMRMSDGRAYPISAPGLHRSSAPLTGWQVLSKGCRAGAHVQGQGTQEPLFTARMQSETRKLFGASPGSLRCGEGAMARNWSSRAGI